MTDMPVGADWALVGFQSSKCPASKFLTHHLLARGFGVGLCEVCFFFLAAHQSRSRSTGLRKALRGGAGFSSISVCESAHCHVP